MEFDQNAMNALLALDDKALWEKIRSLAEKNGIPLPPGEPPAAELSRLRTVLAGKGAKDVAAAAELINRLKKK